MQQPNRWNGPVVATIDLWVSVAVAFLAAVIVLILSEPEPPKQGADRPICDLAIDIEWPVELDVDVDLWAKAPNDKPVGYSSKTSKHLDLVRDDLGWANDPSGVPKQNKERVCARGTPAGEYVANIHFYHYTGAAPASVPVTLTVSSVDASSATMTEILRREVALHHFGEELTVVRFNLDAEGKLIAGSVNQIPRPLRGAVQ